MKILFVCRFNVGRSQMAAALYNKYTQDGHADSSGTMVGAEDGQTLQERAAVVPAAQHVLDTMQAEGLDVSQSKRTQLTEDMLNDYDRVVVMAEPEVIPDYLSKSPKFEYWDIEDPRSKGAEATVVTKDDIKERVIRLIKQSA